MLGVSILAAVIALATGAIIAKFIVPRLGGGRHAITGLEFAIVAGVMVIAIIPLTSAAGKHLSVTSQLTRYQWITGTEEAANDYVTRCEVPDPSSFASMNNSSSGDTNCEHYYDSGLKFKYEEEECSKNSDGKEVCHDVTRRKPIQYPYATVEHRYSIESSMGKVRDGRMKFTFKGVYLDANPVTPHGTPSVRIPDHIPKGAPADWQEAKARLDAGDPRSVTKMVPYDDPILAASDTLRAYSSDIQKYREAGLLPDHTADIAKDPMKGPSKSQVWKVRFAGVTVPNEGAWQDSLMRFNAALGMELRGNLHVVLVDAKQVPSTDSSSYVRALKAHWQDDATYGKRTLGKNAIILVIGVTPGTTTVAWADATTGMPFGNNVMIEYLKSRVAKQPLNPELLFGKPVTVVKGDDYTVTHTAPQMGVIEQVMFQDAPFKRASMTCDRDDDDCVGYEHLVQKIEPGPVAKTMIVVVSSLVAIGLWILAGFTALLDKFHRKPRPVNPTRPHNTRSTRSRVNRLNRKDPWR